MRMEVVLPLPFGPRKPKISPLRHLHGEVVDDGPVAEAFGHPLDIDDDLRRRGGWRRRGCGSGQVRHGRSAGSGLTLTGSPIGRFIAPAGRASIRNTSFARSCSLKMTGGVYSASREMKLTFASIPPGSCRRRR